MMSFGESIKTCMVKKFATMSGRASQAEFWWFQFFIWFVGFLLYIIGTQGREVENVTFVIFAIFLLVTLIPYWSVFVRRLHEVGYSGVVFWWALLISLAGIALVGLIINIFPGNKGDNKFGPDPRNINPEKGSLEAEVIYLGIPNIDNKNVTEEITDVQL